MNDALNGKPRHHFIWSMPLLVKLRFDELLIALSNTNEEDDEAYAIRDEIRSLPGFPHEAHPTQDLIHIEVTDRRVS